MTVEKLVGWCLVLTPLVVILGPLVYICGWMGIAVVAGALGMTAMIVKGVDMTLD